MYCKISYKYDSENEKNIVKNMMSKLCKMYDSYLLTETGMYIYLFVEHECIDRFKRNFSKRSTMFKTKNNIQLDKKFTYEDTSVFYIQNVRNCIIIEEKNFSENIENEVTGSISEISETTDLTHNQENTLSNSGNECLTENINAHQEIAELFSKLIVLRFTNKSKYYKVLQTLEMLL